MPNRAFRLAADLLNSYKAAAGLGRKSELMPAHASMVSMDLIKAGVHAAVADNIFHDFQRQLYARKSEIEDRGRAWRKAHGFGRPFFSGNAPGKGHGYGRNETRTGAEQRARERKAQRSAKRKSRFAKIGATVRKMIFRGASRGS